MNLIMAVVIALTPAPTLTAHHQHKPRHKHHHVRHWHGPWRTVQASYEGLDGSTDSCGGRVSPYVLGLASHLPCGTVVWVRYGRHEVRAVTLDHGPYGTPGRELDLWDATVRALGFSSGNAYGVRTVQMALGG